MITFAADSLMRHAASVTQRYAPSTTRFTNAVSDELWRSKRDGSPSLMNCTHSGI
jgi:hypothetical protein